MNARRCLLLLAACSLLMAGCRTDPLVNSQLDSMRAEYLALENDYFALEDEYLAKCRALQTCRNGDLDEEPGDGEGRDDDDSGDEEIEPPEIDFGTPGAPDIDFGTPIDPDQSNSSDGPARSRSVLQPASDSQLPAPQASIERAPTDLHLSHIIINPYLTAGHDFDSKPGDDGIALMIEPRNSDDQLIPVAGETTIVVLDPALEGDAARVARWQFTAEEAARRVKRAAPQRGVSFKLPWPDGPPEHSKLHVFVRMQSEEGKVYEADTEFYVILPGQFSQRWTPQSTNRGAQSEFVDQAELAGTAAVVEAEPQRQPLPASLARTPLDDEPSVVPVAHQEMVAPTHPARPVWKPFR